MDELNDPQNLGGIIRTAGSLGDFDIVLPSTESVGITESVLRVACGGENYLRVARVSNLANAIQKTLKTNPDASLEDLIKLTLKNI